ncbi:MAG: T9SS type A sorting domain-containing protein [Candidatus Cloacimonetes bacterium]|nr:T9SS type A sorting domain-containing protein [Candidatus Cloacimonadota bacterium]
MKRLLALIFCLVPLLLGAANFFDLPTQVEQPDGSVLDLLASGDEYANRLHDADGYTIIQSPYDGWYYYAIRSGGEPAPSAFRVGSADPRALGLEPGIDISPARYRQKLDFMNSHPRSGSKGPNTGTVNNLVVYIKFSDQTEFSDPRSVYDAKFNAGGDDDLSLRNYFHQVSYDQLDYVSHHYPDCAPNLNLSYTDSHPRAYYLPYNSVTNPTGYRDYQRTDREHQLLANALNFIAPQVPPTLDIDADDDQYVDNVCFIIRGPHSAWADLLWAHRWALYTQDVYINGKMVWDFTFQPENQNSVRTLCHEMFHSVGAPDLYHYDFDGLTPAGCWDIMESGAGHMGMYMKLRYGGWIDAIPAIGPGTFTLNPVTSPVNSVFRYDLNSSETLVFEYRKRGADIFEENLPGSGLLIYRVNSDLDGNADGPPDEVYIYRPGGTQYLNGSIFDATFSAQSCRTAFNQYTDPFCFLGGGNPFPVNIHSVSEAHETITFTLSTPASPYPPLISELVPADGAILTAADNLISADIEAPGSNLSLVEFSLDGLVLGTSYAEPWSFSVPDGWLTPGFHLIGIRAVSDASLEASAQARVRVVDPLQPTWFGWLSDSPQWDEYGRGAVPIQVALELDLGAQQYLLKQIAFDAVADPWGLPAQPGLVNAQIRRFAAGAITDEILLDIGNILSPMNGRFEYLVNSQTPISGRIAVVLNLFEYQNIRFDVNGASGHSWFTEPGRPWTDALARGMLGAAAIELQLQAPGSASGDLISPAPDPALRAWPNPFAAAIALSFELKNAQTAELAIYNLRGQKVRSLLNSTMEKGPHSLVWDGLDQQGRPVAPSVYFCRLSTEKESFTIRLARIK